MGAKIKTLSVERWFICYAGVKVQIRVLDCLGMDVTVDLNDVVKSHKGYNVK